VPPFLEGSCFSNMAVSINTDLDDTVRAQCVLDGATQLTSWNSVTLGEPECMCLPGLMLTSRSTSEQCGGAWWLGKMWYVSIVASLLQDKVNSSRAKCKLPEIYSCNCCCNCCYCNWVVLGIKFQNVTFYWGGPDSW